VNKASKKALTAFLSSFEGVFDHDWTCTKSNIAAEDGHLIARGATFLRPNVLDESDDWANRGALLANYRELMAALEVDGRLSNECVVVPEVAEVAKDVRAALSEVEHQVKVCQERAIRGFEIFGENTQEAAGILFEDLCERLCFIACILEKLPDPGWKA
jgi:hypothetical protein